MLIQVLCDNANSWMVPYAAQLCMQLQQMGHQVRLLHEHTAVQEGDILLLLSCEKRFTNLNLNKHNLVVHESDLPKGKGWSPLTWQILEGKNTIPVTLFEAGEEIDSGNIYSQYHIGLNGTELVEELRQRQAEATIQLVKDFVNSYPLNQGRPQEGSTSFYPRRKPEDSRLEIDKTIAEQFNLLRVCDNERYPAYFELNGQKFILKIEKA